MSLIIAAFVVAGGSTAGVLATQSSGPAQQSIAYGDCAPGQVANTLNANGWRTVDVKWSPPPSQCGGVDHYLVVPIDAGGTPGKAVAQVAADKTTATFTGRDLCTNYSYGVQAVFNGQQPVGPVGPGMPAGTSPLGRPPKPVFVSGHAAATPQMVTIILQGIGSRGSQSAFDPGLADFCTSPDGSMPPANSQPAIQTMATQWLNYDKNDQTGQYTVTNPSTRGAGPYQNMLDALARHGDYVLPFSYTGATITTQGGRPWFSVNAYTSTDVANGVILSLQNTLDTEIADARQAWPEAKIVVIGHSNGGLIAEQWWLHHRSNLHQVTQVFSLDSPLNGVNRAYQCLDGVVVPFLCEKGLPKVKPVFDTVSKQLLTTYAQLWSAQSTNDPVWAAAAAQDKVFTPIGTLGDPLYDMGDWPATGTFGVKNIGLMSQLYWSEPSCQNSGFDLSSASDCSIVGRGMQDPCSPLPDGSGPFFGAKDDMWMHSVVKNCPQLIVAIDNLVAQIAAPKPPPSPSPTCIEDCACPAPQFLALARAKAGPTVDAAGPPKCMSGYAVELFTPYPNGQLAPFFFKEVSPGQWAVIEGGSPVPTVACTAIPAAVMKAFGYGCPNQAPIPAPPPTTAAPVSAGHGTPQAAVYGLLAAELAGRWAGSGGVCSYLQPSQQATCAGLVGGSGASSGNFQVADAVLQGSKALVEVTGSITAADGSSASNTTPTAGMPPAGGSFNQVWNYAATTTDTILSPVACIRVGLDWYVVQGG